MASLDWRFLLLFGLFWFGFSAAQVPVLLSSYSHPETWLRPYDWAYLRVDLPPWFSSMVVTFVSNVNIDKDSARLVPKSKLPVICLKSGSPPLLDISGTYPTDLLLTFPLNGSFGAFYNLSSLDLCIPFQENLTLTLTNEQISPGVLYFGFFNGLGPERTQSKMISRGEAYKFSARINVEGCTTSTIWGPYCNQTIDSPFCSETSIFKNARNLLGSQLYHQAGSLNHPVSSKSRLGGVVVRKQEASNASNVFVTAESLITCNNSFQSSCIGYGEFKYYSLDIVGLTSQFTIMATEFKLSGMLLMCYARYNAMPLHTTYDYSADISKDSLIVKSPKIGRWYIAVQAVNQSSTYSNSSVCFSYIWQLQECLDGKAGGNCTWDLHKLQRIPRRGSGVPYESYYLPVDENESITSSPFSVEPLLSNASVDNVSWTYFSLEIPPGAAGANMHVQLTSNTQVNYELFARYGGMASIDNWDYYANSTSSRNGSMISAIDDSDKGQINFYILYPREGTWSFGLKNTPETRQKSETAMSIALVGCPRHCSSNGDCRYSVEGSGFTFISYCWCDRDHGGFDCSDVLVTRQGHIWQSIFLIASNAAAILPAYSALRQKAFAEWVLFTSSGISSGLYHACDVGTWCVLSFRVLQFMDFWLSFMAVVSTFVYMTTIDESLKRAIHTCMSIFTALLAVTGATRSANITLVVAIGTLGLIFGWLLEFSTTNRFRCYSLPELHLNMPERWLSVRNWFHNLINTLRRRFRWLYLLSGFVALAAAAISWKLETNQSYWIWHSLWHITIYTSSFFFLCSTVLKSTDEDEQPHYELTRQNSASRLE
ncbi:NGX6/PGAP6/MYMK protein [Dioscorea alata]|uniref:NGX6/PGAP6/MYMK protein n=1 Tax=Dioscorea alata TaxID=55571 RepID=A0ACB7UQB1_DIOAL|nr:NGX6/PGAP6/MYMK protein [Dioscorea alata]